MKKILGWNTPETNWLKDSDRHPIRKNRMVELHLEVQAGLANRIRAMVSGICAAEELGIPLVVHWPASHPACHCSFETIFDPDSLPSFVSVNRKLIQSKQQCLSPDDWEQVKKKWNNKIQINIGSYGKFYGGTAEREERFVIHLRGLKPTEHIRKEIDKRIAFIDIDKTLGVHIRRGDNTKSIDASPYSAFIKTMMDDPALYFVVATDDELLKQRTQQHFMDRAVFPSKVLSRVTEEGMVEAAIDFFALARCKRILGSACSSFTDMAAAYGGAELTLAKAD